MCSQLECTPFLRQDRLRLKSENVFINLKCSFQFDFLPKVFTHDCVVHEKGKTDKSKKFNTQRVESPFNRLYKECPRVFQSSMSCSMY